jgi:hypothetical protein
MPSHCHRRNAADRAIRTFKEHFVAGYFSVDPTFPLHLWDIILPQAEITLNLKLLHTRDQENDVLGHPTDIMDIRWGPQCIIADVKMCTSRPRLVSAS